MMLGYGAEHGKGTYRVYKFNTKRVVLSRDVIWQPFQRRNITEETSMFDAGVLETPTIPDTQLVLPDVDMHSDSDRALQCHGAC